MTQERERRYRRRQRTNRVALALSLAAMAFGVFWLVWILLETVRLGFAGLTWATLSQATPPPNDAGGLLNAIWGSLLMVLLATCVATPVGIMAGVYLAEYDRRGWLGNTTRFVNDILLSAPSIVIGLFVYAVVVVRFQHFSGWAGALALALIVVPIVIRTTENMLLLVPHGLREAAYALGATTWEVVFRVVLPHTRAGVVGAIMLGLGRALGETMAVTFVIGNFNQFDASSLFAPANSITSALANEFAEAASGLHQASLIYLGLVLFLITFVVLAFSRLLLARMRKCEGARA
jgi:phosphate transport system permease protein